MKPTRTLSSYVLLVGVLGLSIVGGVVIYQIYAAAVNNQTTPEQTIAIKPLDGVINQTTLDSLEKRKVYSDSEMNLIINTPIALPTPETITASPSAALIATQEATQNNE